MYYSSTVLCIRQRNECEVHKIILLFPVVLRATSTSSTVLYCTTLLLYCTVPTWSSQKRRFRKIMKSQNKTTRTVTAWMYSTAQYCNYFMATTQGLETAAQKVKGRWRWTAIKNNSKTLWHNPLSRIFNMSFIKWICLSRWLSEKKQKVL
jgi:hypothetical protein